MSTCSDHVPIHDIPSSVVVVRTLGALVATRNQKTLKWEGSGVGGRKLKCAFSYLLAHRGNPVSREALIAIARASAVVSGLRRMFHFWGIDDALQQIDHCVVLVEHGCLVTDTDRLEQYLEAAQRYRSQNNLPCLLRALGQAEKLCSGEYLPRYDATPEYSIEVAAARWRECQKKTLRATAEARVDSGDHSLCAAAIGAAIGAIRFDLENPDSYWFVASIARRCGNEGVARLYELRAIAAASA